MKKMITAIAASVTILGLAACAGEESTGGTQVGGTQEITAWAWDPNFNIRALNLATEIFEGINPDITVNVVENAQDSIIQQLNVMMSSGTANGLPNIVLIEDYRAQVFLQAFPDMFFEMSDFIDVNEFAPYKIPMTSIDGRQYGVPFDTGATGLYVRTDILESAGLSVADVTDLDWDQLIEVGLQVKEATGLPMMTLDPSDLGIIRSMIQTTGTWYTEEDGITPFIEGNEQLKAGFEVFRRLIDEGIVLPVTDWSQFVSGFNNGDVWAVPTGNWITASIMAAEDQAGNWAVVSQPRLPGFANSVNASNLGGSSWYVLNVDGKEAAAEFLASTFGSSIELYESLLNEIGAIGTFIPALASSVMDQEVEFFGGQRIFSDFADWTQQIPQVNFGLHTYALEDILAVAMQSYLNGQDLDQVLRDAQAQANNQLN
ncbi:MAG: ABC transporter substrate-binding protein [Turicibacter sp.]|nr:ABC transporter substrate-binding protein [Turicibacter sp.]